MAAPTSYTEATLKQFVVDELGAVATAFGLTTSSAQVVNAVYAVSRVLDDDIADLTDMAKVEAVARWQAWRAAKAAAAGQYDLKAGTSSLSRSQFFDHIATMLADAEQAALRYDEVVAVLAGGAVGYVGGMTTAGSPYGTAPCVGW